MARISTKNAHLIRRGIRDGKRLVLQSQTGMAAFYMKSHESSLEHRAFMHMIDNELDRLARKSADLLNKLQQGKF